MEIDIATRASWTSLARLRAHILDGTVTTAVESVKQLLMNGLADAIELAEWRREAKNTGISYNKLMITIDLSVIPNERKTAGPETERTGISMIAQLDDALTEKKTTRKDLIIW